MIRLLTAAALLGVAALLGAAGCSEAVPPEAPTLRNSTSMPVGATISLRDRFEGQPTENLRTPFYAALVAEHFNSITVENMMKLSNIAVGEGTYEWTHADEAVRFAEANDIRLHGHTLFWHYSIPGFIREMEGDTARIGQIFDQIVDDYIGRYKGKVAGWDIVNEVVNDQSDSMRETFWYRNLGPGYIARAFRRAHAADPDAILFYNEYKIARDSLKFSRVLKVLDELQANDVPIHGVGFQMHVEYDVPSLDQVRNVFRELVKRDLVIHVSELDIAVNPRDTLRFTVMTDSLLQRQRERIEQLTQIYIEEVPEDLRYGITMWGVSDKYSWYRTYLRYLDWPLLFDSHYRPKPAYDGLLEAARAGAPRKSGAS